MKEKELVNDIILIASIVCWVNKWKSIEKEVVELSELLKNKELFN